MKKKSWSFNSASWLSFVSKHFFCSWSINLQHYTNTNVLLYWKYRLKFKNYEFKIGSFFYSRLKLYVKSTMKDLTYQYYLQPFQPIVWLVIAAGVLILTALKWSFHRAAIRKTRFAAAFFTILSSLLQQGKILFIFVYFGVLTHVSPVTLVSKLK